MQSSLVAKMQKAKKYAAERERMRVDGLHVSFRGENSDHDVRFVDGRWSCNCDFFSNYHVCSHTMALEKVLEGMVPPQRVPLVQTA